VAVTPATLQGVNEQPAGDAIRKSIESQVCAWCGAGPFKSLFGHVAQKHGVTKRAAYVIAGLPYYVPSCSRQTSELLRDNLVGDKDRAERLLLSASVANATHGRRKADNYSRKRACQHLRDGYDVWRKENPTAYLESRRRAAAAMNANPATIDKGREAAKRRRVVPEDEYQDIIDRVASGVSMRSIAREYGRSDMVIRRIVNRERARVSD